MRRIATASRDLNHQEHDRCCDCYQEDGTEAHLLAFHRMAVHLD
jgi:hypothetical protein